MDVKAHSSTHCIHHFIEQQAQKTPDAHAVVFGTQKISYRQLNDRADSLASTLIKAGVLPDTLVGLCVPRSVELIIGIIAIWKAGAGYVPIDPNYPANRVRYLVEDSKIGVVITNADLVTTHFSAAPGDSLKVLTPDFTNEDAHNARTSVPHEIAADHSDNLAYVIYTSGSTGNPKGVQIEHHSVINLYDALSQALSLKSFPIQYQAALNASVSFDASVQQFIHLTTGATLHIVPDELRNDPRAFVDYLIKNHIVCLDVTPSLMALLLPYMPNDPVGDLPIHILIGGEAISPTLWRSLVHCRAVKTFNVYGPTEATVDTTIAHINNADEAPHIGKAIPNTQCHVLDGNMKPTPLGTVGELYIGGHGLARGYLHKPELTRERFISDPFSEDTEARLYRTGDNVILLADGNIQYVGRIDNQVKVRGFRIELGEIEAALLDFAQVNQAAVIIAGATAEERYLAAFVTQDEKNGGASTESFVAYVKSELQASLPAHLIPSRFHVLDKLPLNPSGKVDRHALTRIDAEYKYHSSGEMPRNQKEEQIAELWRDLLQVQEIGIRDNFFDLGGHSLLLIRLISQLREKMGLDLCVSNVFENPTIESIASSPFSTDSFLVKNPLKPAPQGQEDLLSFEEMTFFEFGGENSPLCMTAELKGSLNVSALIDSILIALKKHAILRSRFVATPDIRKRIIQEDLSNAVRFENVEALFQGTTYDDFVQLIVRETPRLDAVTQLFYATIYKLEENHFCLSMAAGHIVSELISFDIFLSDVAQAYNAIISGHHVQSLPATIQYGDYAHWQREYVASEEVQETLRFWREELSNLPPHLDFPSSVKREDATYSQTRGRPFSLSKTISDAIINFSRKEGSTVFITLLAILSKQVASHCRQDDIVIVSPVTNRYFPALEDLVGCFVNLTFFRNKVKSGTSFRQLAGQVKRNAIRVYSHQKTPLLPVVGQLTEQYGVFPSQVFQVMLDMTTKPAALELSGMEPAYPVIDQIHPYNPVPGSTMDLIWLLEETAEGFKCKLNYNSAIFSLADADRLIEDFRNAVSNAMENPDELILVE